MSTPTPRGFECNRIGAATIGQLCGPNNWLHPVLGGLCPASSGPGTTFSTGHFGRNCWLLTRTLQRSRDPDGNLDCTSPPTECFPTWTDDYLVNIGAYRAKIFDIVTADEFGPATFTTHADGQVRLNLSSMLTTRYRTPEPRCLDCYGGHSLCHRGGPNTRAGVWVVPLVRLVGVPFRLLHLVLTDVHVPYCHQGCVPFVMMFRFYPTVFSNLPLGQIFGGVRLVFPPHPDAQGTNEDECRTQVFNRVDVYIPTIWCDQMVDVYFENAADEQYAAQCDLPYPWPHFPEIIKVRISFYIREGFLEPIPEPMP